MRFFIIFSFLIVLSGCSNTPDELRGLKPATVKVFNGDKPLEGVLVSLNPKEAQSLRGCNGVTDAAGTAVIHTTISQKSKAGAEPGGYKVVLYQNFVMPPDLAPRPDEDGLSDKEQKELQTKRQAWMLKNRVIPEIYEHADKTPIELTVDPNNGGELVVDVSKQ
ncbi:MAG: hypothetical protein FWE67_05785 [Planctomycetaceae bacterium]|nr:hypothetical protein [Planctomycetaceae bacterium]